MFLEGLPALRIGHPDSPAAALRFCARGAGARLFCPTLNLTPTLNAMMIVGIVKLPGVMTGQMLGGAAPFAAAKYQIVIMFMLFFSDGVTAVVMLRWLRSRAFNAAWQLRL